MVEGNGGEPLKRPPPGTTLSELEHEAIQQCLSPDGGQSAADCGTPGDQHPHAAAQDPRIRGWTTPSGNPLRPATIGSSRPDDPCCGHRLRAGSIRRARPSRGRTECRTPAGMRHPVRSGRPGDGRVIDARAGHPCGNLFTWSAARAPGHLQVGAAVGMPLERNKGGGRLRDPPSRHLLRVIMLVVLAVGVADPPAFGGPPPGPG